MTDQHLLIVDVSGGVATLRDKSGGSFTIPAAWLPSRASQGAAVIVSVADEAERASISLGLVEGTSVPEGTDIGA